MWELGFGEGRNVSPARDHAKSEADRFSGRECASQPREWIKIAAKRLGEMQDTGLCTRLCRDVFRLFPRQLDAASRSQNSASRQFQSSASTSLSF